MLPLFKKPPLEAYYCCCVSIRFRIFAGFYHVFLDYSQFPSVMVSFMVYLCIFGDFGVLVFATVSLVLQLTV